MELEHAAIAVASEAPVPVVYKGRAIKLGFRADLLIEGAVIVELKAVASLLPAHEAQVLTNLRMSGLRVGLLMNFHARLLKDGLVRFAV